MQRNTIGRGEKMLKTTCEISESCGHRIECLYSNMDEPLEFHIDVVQGGDQVDRGSFYFHGCPGRADQILREFWVLVDNFFKSHLRKMTVGGK